MILNFFILSCFLHCTSFRLSFLWDSTVTSPSSSASSSALSSGLDFQLQDELLQLTSVNKDERVGIYRWLEKQRIFRRTAHGRLTDVARKLDILQEVKKSDQSKTRGKS